MQPLYNFLVSILDWFIPDHLAAAEEDKRRVRSFLICHVLGPPFGIIVAGCLIYYHPVEFTWLLGAGVLFFLVFPFLLRWSQRFDEVALLSVLHLMGLIFFVAYNTGGATSPALPWALTVPIVSVFFVAGWYRLITFLVLFAGCTLLIALDSFGYPFPTHFTDSSPTIDLVLLLSAGGYASAMALTYINVYDFTIERLKWAKDAAESASRAKSEFLATMSHELRTPLNAVIGFSQMLTHQHYGQLGHPKYLEYAQDIEMSSQHLLQIINDILDIVKIEAGRFDVSDHRIDPQIIAEQAVAITGPLAAKKNIDLKLSLPASPPPVVGDQRLLRQVLINLLSNAVKFTPENGSVLLKVTLEDGHPDWLRFEVRDSGEGIPESEIKRVQQPFEQIESALARKNGGIGLGLPISKKIVELHGGLMKLQSQAGQGTRAKVRLRTLSDDVHTPPAKQSGTGQ